MVTVLKKLGFAKISLVFVLAFTWSALLVNDEWKTDHVIGSDMNSYYIYLPAAFIYNDLSFNYINDTLPPEVLRSSWVVHLPDDAGNVSKTTCGIAIMLSPFFLVAHWWSLFCHNAANGYTHVYALAVCMATFFYFMIGLLFLFKTLSRFFDKITTGSVLIAIGLGTNVFIYSTYSFSTPHVFSFCLFSIFIWQAIQWHDHPKTSNWMMLGLLLGFITLVRPNDILIALFPLLYGIMNNATLQLKIKTFLQNPFNILLAMLCFILALLPQLIIWKIQTGSFIYYSYEKESFYFNHPHILEGLFGFRKGLFIYTPILLFILPGFIIAWHQKKPFALVSMLFFFLNVYILFSWWSWWYGASFGMRPMIDSYPLLALPLGSFIDYVQQRKKYIKFVMVAIFAMLIFLNQFQSLQSQTNLLHFSDMTFKTYKLIFGRLTFPKGYDESLLPNDNEMARQGLPERNFYTTFPFLKGHKTGVIVLKAANGRYVSVDTTDNQKLKATVSSINDACIFKVNIEGFQNATIQSFQGKYVSFDSMERMVMVADRSNQGTWEQFTIENLTNNRFALKAYNGKYINLNPPNNLLQANTENLSNAESFQIIAQ